VEDFSLKLSFSWFRSYIKQKISGEKRDYRNRSFYCIWKKKSRLSSSGLIKERAKI